MDFLGTRDTRQNIHCETGSVEIDHTVYDTTYNKYGSVKNTAIKKKTNILYTNADSLWNKIEELNYRINDSLNNGRHYWNLGEKYWTWCRIMNFLCKTAANFTAMLKLSVSAKLQATPVEFSAKYNESTWVSVKRNDNENMLIGCMYCSHNSNDKNNCITRRIT